MPVLRRRATRKSSGRCACRCICPSTDSGDRTLQCTLDSPYNASLWTTANAHNRTSRQPDQTRQILATWTNAPFRSIRLTMVAIGELIVERHVRPDEFTPPNEKQTRQSAAATSLHLSLFLSTLLTFEQCRDSCIPQGRSTSSTCQTAKLRPLFRLFPPFQWSPRSPLPPVR